MVERLQIVDGDIGIPPEVVGVDPDRGGDATADGAPKPTELRPVATRVARQLELVVAEPADSVAGQLGGVGERAAVAEDGAVGVGPGERGQPKKRLDAAPLPPGQQIEGGQFQRAEGCRAGVNQRLVGVDPGSKPVDVVHLVDEVRTMLVEEGHGAVVGLAGHVRAGAALAVAHGAVGVGQGDDDVLGGGPGRRGVAEDDAERHREGGDGEGRGLGRLSVHGVGAAPSRWSSNRNEHWWAYCRYKYLNWASRWPSATSSDR